MGLSANILGASGYTGGELLRLLLGHPALSVAALGAHSRVGNALSSVHPHLTGLGDVDFVDVVAAAATPADICFSCMPSGSLAALLDAIKAPIVIDLSDDHRATPGWTYGLTEHARAEVAGSAAIANPGCYPTATLLGLLPFVQAGLIGAGPVIVDAMSGVSGAGKGLDDSLSFSALHGSVGAYGPSVHRHVPEMERGLEDLGGHPIAVSFTPHLVPIARGLLVTARAVTTSKLDDAGALDVLNRAYASEPFVTVIEGWPSTKAVFGTNRAVVSARVDTHTGLLIVSSAIDNLGKGAAGQALQNANIALGLDETAGLEQVAVWP